MLCNPTGRSFLTGCSSMSDISRVLPTLRAKIALVQIKLDTSSCLSSTLSNDGHAHLEMFFTVRKLFDRLLILPVVRSQIKTVLHDDTLIRRLFRQAEIAIGFGQSHEPARTNRRNVGEVVALLELCDRRQSLLQLFAVCVRLGARLTVLFEDEHVRRIFRRNPNILGVLWRIANESVGFFNVGYRSVASIPTTHPLRTCPSTTRC